MHSIEKPEGRLWVRRVEATPTTPFWCYQSDGQGRMEFISKAAFATEGEALSFIRGYTPGTRFGGVGVPLR